MEDSITESELKTGVEDYQQDEAHKGHVGNGEVLKKGGESNESKMDVEEERNGGLINHIISNLVTPSSPKSRESVEVNKTEVNKDENGEDQVEVGGGIINNLISNFFHHGEGEGEGEEVKDKMDIVVDQVDDGNKQVHKEGKEKGEMEVSGGGIINNLISNLFHQNGGEGDGGGDEEEKSSEERKEEVGIEGNEQVKVEEEEGGGGIIKNIVSNLPASLQEDYVPASDEASILIHSIIHD